MPDVLRVTTESGTVYTIVAPLSLPGGAGGRVKCGEGRVLREGGGPLREDAEWIPLVASGWIEKGQPMRMLLDLASTPADVLTERVTTPVVSVEFGVLTAGE